MTPTIPTTPTLTPLMRIQLQVATPCVVGEGPLGNRKFVAITGGEFSGERIKGRVIGGGGDWLLQRSDGCVQLDARYTLQTDDGALIYVQDRGLRHGAAEVMAQLARGEAVSPADYYFRTGAQLETASANYAWLNQRIIVGSGARQQQGVVIDFFTVE